MAAEAQSKAVEAQLEDRPLAKMQEALDDAADDEDDVPRTPPSDVDPAENGSPTTTLASNGSPNPPASPSRHKGKPLLKNDDVELDRVFKVGWIGTYIMLWVLTISCLIVIDLGRHPREIFR